MHFFFQQPQVPPQIPLGITGLGIVSSTTKATIFSKVSSIGDDVPGL